LCIAWHRLNRHFVLQLPAQSIIKRSTKRPVHRACSIEFLSLSCLPLTELVSSPCCNPGSQLGGMPLRALPGAYEGQHGASRTERPDTSQYMFVGFRCFHRHGSSIRIDGDWTLQNVLNWEVTLHVFFEPLILSSYCAYNSLTLLFSVQHQRFMILEIKRSRTRQLIMGLGAGYLAGFSVG
jgi:hypothetical protein